MAVGLLAVLPFVTVLTLFVVAIQEDTIAFDFRPYHGAAGAVLEGRSPYPGPQDPLTAETRAYVYPPLPALAAVPLRTLPEEVAGVVVMVLLCAAAVATLFVLGVRDWRCYGVAFLWPPILSAIQTGNLTLVLALLAALAWRLRDRPFMTSACVGVTLAAKFFLWPLVVWLGATRRLVGAGLACVVGLALLLGSWAVIGFAGLVDYPELMRRLDDSIGLDSYTAYIVGLDIGLPSPVARVGWLALGLGVLVAVVVLGRRGDEQTAFVLAIVAALALTPIVWLHYFAFLLVVVAVARPSLGLVWFVPLGMVVTPGSGHPTPFETAATLVVASITVGLAVRESLASFQGGEPAAVERALVAS